MGLAVEPLAKRNHGTLIYVYRPEMLEARLNDLQVAKFLRAYGYDPTSARDCMSILRRRMRMQNTHATADGQPGNFPHEIGVFLGYPLEDVIGFVENNGANSLASGCWKVYANVEEAIECFARYKECARCFEERYEAGDSLESLMSEGMFSKGAAA